MSELIDIKLKSAILRRQLLATTSASVFFLIASTEFLHAADAQAEPKVWIELGGQFEGVAEKWNSYAPPFLNAVANSGFSLPYGDETTLSSSFGGEGKISFEPGESDWIVSASVRYGRSRGQKKRHEQTSPKTQSFHTFGTYFSIFGTTFRATVRPRAAQFADVRIENSESHAVVDFQVGRDVGLGIFRGQATAIVNFGLRYAQFSSKSSVKLGSDPDFQFFDYTYFAPFKAYFPNAQKWHEYYSSSSTTRSFHGVGPSISVTSSIPVGKTSRSGGVELDWGLNAAVLFGRQQAKGQHQVRGQNVCIGFICSNYISTYSNPEVRHSRSRSVIVPNVGGFVGAALAYPNAKFSLGYRADFFFGAVDGGVDTAHQESLGFHGPFATISIGLGG